MKELTVVNGVVELHGEHFEIEERYGSFLAIDSLIDEDCSFTNDVFQFESPPELTASLAETAWLFGGEYNCIGELSGLPLDKCKNELYKLNFEISETNK